MMPFPVTFFSSTAAAPSALLTSLVSHWKLDEASSGTAAVTRNDSHGTNHLTDVNTVPSAPGLMGNSASFNAANLERLIHGHNSSLAVTDEDFTVACWFYLTAQQNGARLVSKRSANNNCDYDLYLDNTGRVYAEIRNSAGTGKLVSVAGVVLNAWNLCVGWHDAAGDTINIQLNNGTPGSAATAGIIPGGTGEFRIGELQQVSRPLTGRVDSASLWKRMLTDAERTSLYNGGAGLDYPFS